MGRSRRARSRRLWEKQRLVQRQQQQQHVNQPEFRGKKSLARFKAFFYIIKKSIKYKIVPELPRTRTGGLNHILETASGSCAERRRTKINNFFWKYLYVFFFVYLTSTPLPRLYQMFTFALEIYQIISLVRLITRRHKTNMQTEAVVTFHSQRVYDARRHLIKSPTAFLVNSNSRSAF